MKKFKWIITITILLILVFFLSINIKIIYKNNNKKNNSVNNKSIKEIEQSLLNIDSYTATIQVMIKSNKNENQYMIKQEVKKDIEKQIILEPEELKNIEFMYENNVIKINNYNIGSSKEFNQYKNISNNMIFLTDFIKEYKNTEFKEITEEQEKIAISINNKENIYNNKIKLIVNKETYKPESIEIKDTNNNTRVYILYNEIEINNI